MSNPEMLRQMMDNPMVQVINVMLNVKFVVVDLIFSLFLEINVSTSIKLTGH